MTLDIYKQTIYNKAMQTFLPYNSFQSSATVLDRQRLGKQRVETSQILDCLDGIKSGWKNHPAVKMWQGYENALALYGLQICDEWIRRGYKDSLRPKFENRLINQTIKYPYWLGCEKFHASHRAALLWKNYNWYQQFNWSETPALNYIWPPIISASYD